MAVNNTASLFNQGRIDSTETCVNQPVSMRTLVLTDHSPKIYIVLMSDKLPSIKDILGPKGLLARSLKAFEFRPSQMDMALLIQDALQKEAPAVVEAGTGTGKTFGYLVPIVLSGKKAVISTGTKNLKNRSISRISPF